MDEVTFPRPTPIMEIRPWRTCPFTAGRRYRVRRDHEALRDRFQAGEVLVYVNDAWSRYDEYTGYFFCVPDTTQHRVWDISEGEDLEIWREIFEELPEAGTSDP